MEKMKEKIYYSCYSDNLKDFLYNKGYKYLIKCRHYETLNPMWIYMYDTKGLLSKYLEEWKTVRKLYKED